MILFLKLLRDSKHLVLKWILIQRFLISLRLSRCPPSFMQKEGLVLMRALMTRLQDRFLCCMHWKSLNVEVSVMLHLY